MPLYVTHEQYRKIWDKMDMTSRKPSSWPRPSPLEPVESAGLPRRRGRLGILQIFPVHFQFPAHRAREMAFNSLRGQAVKSPLCVFGEQIERLSTSQKKQRNGTCNRKCGTGSSFLLWPCSQGGSKSFLLLSVYCLLLFYCLQVPLFLKSLFKNPNCHLMLRAENYSP